jgi:hypothetical protein
MKGSKKTPPSKHVDMQSIVIIGFVGEPEKTPWQLEILEDGKEDIEKVQIVPTQVKVLFPNHPQRKSIHFQGKMTRPGTRGVVLVTGSFAPFINSGLLKEKLPV